MAELFNDKVAIVTGGASGIGRGLCEELGKRGARIVVADINADGAQEVAAGINGNGGRAHSVSLDVSCREEVEELINRTASENSRLDYLFNNAGIAIVGDARDLDFEHWERVLQVNLHGVIYGMVAAYQVMARQGFGHIVSTSSLAGLAPVPMVSAYATTKFAVVGLSRSMRMEGAALGVKVSVVCPGLVKTGIFDASMYVNMDPKAFLAQTPRSMVDPNKAARIILRGVKRNRAVIIFPFRTRLALWIVNLFPPLGPLFVRKLVNTIRSLRKEAS